MSFYKQYVSRKLKILEASKDKSVLHLGFIQHKNYKDFIDKNVWLHSEIVNVASKVVGVDYLEDSVSEIKEKYGYECYYADVMSLDKLQLNETFDLVVCGELIEHLENPGKMLEGVKRFMHKDSTLIITTPNPYSLRRIIKIIFGKYDDYWINKEHVAWYTTATLSQLCNRMGFYVEEKGFYVGYRDKLLIRDRVKIKAIPNWLQDGLLYTLKND